MGENFTIEGINDSIEVISNLKKKKKKSMSGGAAGLAGDSMKKDVWWRDGSDMCGETWKWKMMGDGEWLV